MLNPDVPAVSFGITKRDDAKAMICIVSRIRPYPKHVIKKTEPVAGFMARAPVSFAHHREVVPIPDARKEWSMAG